MYYVYIMYATKKRKKIFLTAHLRPAGWGDRIRPLNLYRLMKKKQKQNKKTATECPKYDTKDGEAPALELWGM